MKPINFKLSNKVLQPSGQEYSENINGVDPLPIWTDGEQCVSCWRPSWRERLSILLFGKVWLGILSGSTQYPVWVGGEREYLHEVDE